MDDIGWFGVWWAWVVGGVVIGGLEILLPGYVFLGFAVGAVLTGGLIAIGLLGGSFAVSMLVFAVLSVIAWAAMRAILGTRAGQVKRFDRDINQN